MIQVIDEHGLNQDSAGVGGEKWVDIGSAHFIGEGAAIFRSKSMNTFMISYGHC